MSEQLSEFHPVNREEARKFLNEAVRSVTSVMIWTKEQKHVLKTTLRSYNERESVLYAWVPTETDPSWFLGELEKLGADCYFSIALSKASIFFKSPCLGHDAEGFRFQLPEKVYKVQRRKDPRIMIPFGHTVRVEIPDPIFPEQKFAKKAFDVSSGGISVIVTETEAATFQVGIMLKDISFSLRNRKIKASAVVKHLRPIQSTSGSSGTKIGFQFTQIETGDAEWIANYVSEESRKFVSKIL